MREARGLAYTAWATLATPSNAKGDYSYYAFIATQNDKMQKGRRSFRRHHQQHANRKAFRHRQRRSSPRLRTERTVKDGVLWSYLRAPAIWVSTPRDKADFRRVQSMTLDDVKAAQQKWVKRPPNMSTAFWATFRTSISTTSKPSVPFRPYRRRRFSAIDAPESAETKKNAAGNLLRRFQFQYVRNG